MIGAVREISEEILSKSSWEDLARNKHWRSPQVTHMQTIADSFRPMTDEQLLSEVKVLVARERAATTLVIASLAEIDARQLHLALGHGSLLAYCMSALHMSKSAACNRIHAART